MKVQVAKIDSQASGFLNNTQFGIGDAAMVMEVLRNQLYNDPLFSCIREYLCNARDANREANNASPIEVILPTYSNLFLTISDCGPGISPERMSNIFTQFGMSTKRHTNELTGGFGLGGKSGFAYSDTFNIISVTDGFIRNYTAYIDSSRLGAMTLLKEEITDAPNGTSIVIPIKKEDLDRCKIIIKAITYFWSVRPNFFQSQYNSNNELIKSSCDIGYNEHEQVLYEGDNWYCVKDNKANSLQRYGSSNKLYILIDEIPYDIDVGKFDYNIQSKISALISNNFRIKFNNGELSLAASRDTINYDQKTIKAIISKYEIIANDISIKINEAVSKNSTYLDALIHILEIKGTLSQFKVNSSLNWENRTLYSNNMLSHQFWGSAVEVYHLFSYTRKTSSASIYLYDFFKLVKDNPKKAFILDSDKQSIVSYARNLCNKFNIPDVYLFRINQENLNAIVDASIKADLETKVSLIKEFIPNKISDIAFDKQTKARTNYNRKTLSNKENILAYDFSLAAGSNYSHNAFSVKEVPMEGNYAYLIYDYESKGSLNTKFKFANDGQTIPSWIFEANTKKLCSNLGLDGIYAITPGKKAKVTNSSWKPIELVIQDEKNKLLSIRSFDEWAIIILESNVVNNIISFYQNEHDLISKFFLYMKKSVDTDNKSYKSYDIPYIKKFEEFSSKIDEYHYLSKFKERFSQIFNMKNDIDKFCMLFKQELLVFFTKFELESRAITTIGDLSKLNNFNDNNLIINLLSFIRDNSVLFKNLSSDDRSIFYGHYDHASKLINRIYNELPKNSLELLGYIK